MLSWARCLSNEQSVLTSEKYSPVYTSAAVVRRMLCCLTGGGHKSTIFFIRRPRLRLHHLALHLLCLLQLLCLQLLQRTLKEACARVLFGCFLLSVSAARLPALLRCFFQLQMSLLPRVAPLLSLSCRVEPKEATPISVGSQSNRSHFQIFATFGPARKGSPRRLVLRLRNSASCSSSSSPCSSTCSSSASTSSTATAERQH